MKHVYFENQIQAPKLRSFLYRCALSSPILVNTNLTFTFGRSTHLKIQVSTEPVSTVAHHVHFEHSTVAGRCGGKGLHAKTKFSSKRAENRQLHAALVCIPDVHPAPICGSDITPRCCGFQRDEEACHDEWAYDVACTPPICSADHCSASASSSRHYD